MQDETHDLSLGGETAADDPFNEPEGAPLPPEPVDVSDGPDEERLGGENAPPEDPEPGEETPGDEDSPADYPEPEGEPEPEPEPPAPEPEPPAPEPEDDEPDPIAAAAKEEGEGEQEPQQDAATKAPVRTYFVLEGGTPEAEEWRLRTTVVAHNGEGAVRKAYRELYSENPDTQTTLVVVPQSMWRPRQVQGKASQNVSIEILSD